MNKKNEKLWYLKNLDIFEGMPEEEIMELAHNVEECNFSKDEMIYSTHEAVKSIYVVKRGEVRLFHSIDGKRIVFDVLGPGSIFGGIDFADGKKSSHFAQATHPTRVCIFTETDFTNILTKRPKIMMRFIRKITKQLSELEDRLKNRNYQAEDLILLELIQLREKRQNSLFGRFMPSSIHITHEELAELTGLNRVTVTRSLKKLRENNKIKIENSKIHIL